MMIMVLMMIIDHTVEDDHVDHAVEDDGHFRLATLNVLLANHEKLYFQLLYFMEDLSMINILC